MDSRKGSGGTLHRLLSNYDQFCGRLTGVPTSEVRRAEGLRKQAAQKVPKKNSQPRFSVRDWIDECVKLFRGFLNPRG